MTDEVAARDPTADSVVLAATRALLRVDSRDEAVGVLHAAVVGLESASVGDVVCLLDLDGFKNVNDTLGHIAGDDALHLFGSLLRSTMRDVDFVGRYGGDEFMVIMEAVPPDVARMRMRTLTTAWASEDIHESTVSVGLAPVDDLGATVARSAADRALYRAKRLGRNQVAVATPEEYVSHVRVTRPYQLSHSVMGSIPK